MKYVSEANGFDKANRLYEKFSYGKTEQETLDALAIIYAHTPQVFARHSRKELKSALNTNKGLKQLFIQHNYPIPKLDPVQGYIIDEETLEIVG